MQPDTLLPSCRLYLRGHSERNLFLFLLELFSFMKSLYKSTSSKEAFKWTVSSFEELYACNHIHTYECSPCDIGMAESCTESAPLTSHAGTEDQGNSHLCDRHSCRLEGNPNLLLEEAPKSPVQARLSVRASSMLPFLLQGKWVMEFGVTLLLSCCPGVNGALHYCFYQSDKNTLRSTAENRSLLYRKLTGRREDRWQLWINFCHTWKQAADLLCISHLHVATNVLHKQKVYMKKLLR